MQLDGNLDEDSTRMELLEIVGRPIEQIYNLPVAEILKGPGSPRFNSARQGLAWPSSVYLAGQPATRAFYTYIPDFFLREPQLWRWPIAPEEFAALMRRHVSQNYARDWRVPVAPPPMTQTSNVFPAMFSSTSGRPFIAFLYQFGFTVDRPVRKRSSDFSFTPRL